MLTLTAFLQETEHPLSSYWVGSVSLSSFCSMASTEYSRILAV